MAEPNQEIPTKKDPLLVALWAWRLSDIKRWQEAPDMMNQTDLFIHSLRVEAISKFICGILEQKGVQLNQDKVHDLAIHHDDPEYLTGDIPSPTKQQMTEEEKNRLKEAERHGVSIVRHTFFPNITLQTFQDIFEEYEEQRTIESQITKAADRLDALGEILNELLCGNEHKEFWLDSFRNIQGYLVDFDKYDWWQYIKQDPQIALDRLPDESDIGGDAKIKFNDLDSPNAVANLAKDQGLPSFYRNWIKLSMETFEKDPAKYIFPGWYPYLQDRWGKERGKVKW